MSDCLYLDCFLALVPLDLARKEGGSLILFVGVVPYFVVESKAFLLGWRNRKLLFSSQLNQLFLCCADFCNNLASSVDSLQHDILGDLVGTALNHGDSILDSGNHNLHISLLYLLEGRVDDVLAIKVAYSYRSGWAVERNVRDADSSRSCYHCNYVWRVDLVCGYYGWNNLDIPFECF